MCDINFLFFCLSLNKSFYVTVLQDVTSDDHTMNNYSDDVAVIETSSNSPHSNTFGECVDDRRCNTSEASSATFISDLKPKKGFLRKINAKLSRFIRSLHG